MRPRQELGATAKALMQAGAWKLQERPHGRCYADTLRVLNMQLIRALRGALVAAAFGFSLVSHQAIAAPVVINEVPDAGDALATAQDARVPGGGYVFNGSLSNEAATLDYVDLYRISVNNGFLYASTGDGLDTSLVADPALYLFDAAGKAVAFDDESGGFGQAFLSIVGGLAAGDYYLAVAFGGVEPVDALGNSLFDVFGLGITTSSAGLAGWSGAPLSIDPGIAGAYSVTLLVPVPGTLALASLGLFALGAPRLRLRRS
jgi:hypothetical protein